MDGQVRVLEDGNFVYEVQGLPATDPDADMFPTAHKATKIRFDVGPIKVRRANHVNEWGFFYRYLGCVKTIVVLHSVLLYYV